MNKSMTIVAIAALVLTFVTGAQADIVMGIVPIGNLGNTGEWSGESQPGGAGPDAIVGAVDYAYNIGKYEVTAGQYRDFLNAVDPTGSNPYGIYKGYMDSHYWGCQITWNTGLSTYDFSGRPSGTEADWVDRPVNYVSWGDAARFSNWMHNGQGNADTETGSYALNGAMTISELMLIVREPDATWVIPSEDEWYKSAYHKNDGDTGNYFDYPTSSDSVPGYVNNSGNLSGTGTPFTEDGTDPGNFATYNGDGGTYSIGYPYYRTEVGEWENSASPYGTFDQGGNLWEWSEMMRSGSSRGIRGGSFVNDDVFLHAAYRGSGSPTYEFGNYGFRVAEVPEPATLSLLAFGAVGVLGKRRRVQKRVQKRGHH